MLYSARLALDTIRGLVVVICTFSVSREYAYVAYASGSHHEEAMKLSLSAQPTAALCAFYFILYYSSGMPDAVHRMCVHCCDSNYFNWTVRGNVRVNNTNE